MSRHEQISVTELTHGEMRNFTGAAAPTAGGPYRVGDKTWNNAPAAAGVIGWVCTTAGSPGTWKTFGTIES